MSWVRSEGNRLEAELVNGFFDEAKGSAQECPAGAIEHLARSIRERQVPIEDLEGFASWLGTNPTVPADYVQTIHENCRLRRGRAREDLSGKHAYGHRRRGRVRRSRIQGCGQVADSSLML